MNPKEIEGLSPNVVVLPLIRKPELLCLAEYLKNNAGDVLTAVKEYVSSNGKTGSLFDFAPSEFS